MDSYIVEIFSPRLVGGRFDEHRIPLDFLEDLAIFQEMAIEMAKQIYLEQHPDRQRIPKNFTNGISFELENIGPGSSVPKILLVARMPGLFPHDHLHYFEQAKERIIQTVQAAENGGDINQFAPDSVLTYFNKFGKKLRNDEYIELNPMGEQKAIFTKENRRKLMLASSKSNEFTEEISLKGFIPEMDQAKKTFHIELSNGLRTESNYTDQTEDIIKDAFNGYIRKQKVSVNGTGRFSKANKLLKLESVEEAILLDDLDVSYRLLEELSLLKDGWFNGQGNTLDAEGLQWFSAIFENHFDPELPLPHIFPTVEGGIQAEWSVNEIEITLNIDLKTKTAVYQAVDIQTDQDWESTLNLAKDDDWTKLNEFLHKSFNS